MNPTTKKMCSEDNNVKCESDEAFTPRDYQIEIFEIAKKRNTIACLGTGTGKTFIAVMLIREYAREVRLPYVGGGKRIFFLVPTVPLVHQQKGTIERHTDLKVKGYSGDMNTDTWNKDKWTSEFIENQVLVMTAEIFRIILHHEFIRYDKISLIVVDECHRAQGDHPYRLAMKSLSSVKSFDPSKMPRIFGLSASLLNGKCKPTQLEKNLRNLENTMFSTITTASDIVDLQRYGADPQEYIVYFKPYSLETELFEKINAFKKRISDENISVGRGSEFITEDEIIFLDKPLHCLNSLQVMLESLGPWCALKAAEIYSEELESVLLRCSGMLLSEVQQEILSGLKEFLADFKKECVKLNFDFTPNNIHRWPNKLMRLLEILVAVRFSQRFSPASQGQPRKLPDYLSDPEQYRQILKENEERNRCGVQVCAIIFVEQRIFAYVLKQWIAEVTKIHPELDYVVPEFVVGHGNTGVRNTSMSEKQQKKALKDFREKRCNVLVATSVLEEGMDVQQCNLVIRFDLPKDFRGYVQSKGRARAKHSVYVMMCEMGEKSGKFWSDLLNFKTIEKMLLSECHDRPEVEDEESLAHLSDDPLPPYMPYGPLGPQISLKSAISLINRYCACLPSDLATKLTPKWFVRNVDQDSTTPKYQCQLKMPINSPLRELIVGEEMPRKKIAKMAAALKACQLLHEIEELNEHLVPISYLVEKALEEEMGVVEEEDGNGAIPGTHRRRQVYNKRVPKFIQNCFPVPSCENFLHVLRLELVEPLPSILNPRGRPLINPAESHRGLAVLLSKKLPAINAFPIFTKSGKVKVTVDLVETPCFLTKPEIDSLKEFHEFVFSETLQLGKQKTFNPESYFVVPVHTRDRKNWMIDWQFIQETKTHPYHLKKSNLLDQMDHDGLENPNNPFVFEDNAFQGAVMLRSYKVKCWGDEKPTFHHFKRILKDLHPTDVMDDKKLETFVDYYKRKYNCAIRNPLQPLIETYQDPTMHKWKPLYISKKQAFDDGGIESETKKRRKAYVEYLVPELCLIHPFPSSFFHQVMCLPTVLFRLHCLLLAEDLRQEVASCGLMCVAELSREFQWPYFSLETSDRPLKKHLAELGKGSAETSPFIPSDIVKKGNIIVSFETRIDLSHHPGPSPSLLLQALTSLSAGDEFNLERLEMIGDSFLKYTMSVKCYIKYKNFDEGKLTRLRSKLIQNLHLYQCAKRKKIPEYLICSKFCCETTWLPPCYSVEEEVVRISNNKKKDDKEDNSSQKYHFFRKQIISDKCVADSVEALIGAYLLTCGQRGALMFMSWLGLNPLPHKKDSEADRTDFESWPPEAPNPIVVPVTSDIGYKIGRHLDGFDAFERSIKYTFKNKALLLQAFTHPSYSYNDITDCYQRLEFLGDAVLDFLITRQLYEDPNELSPGQLTDLRSALVNNIYFAALAVKYKYNKYLKILSPQLFRLLDHYVQIYEGSELCKFFEEFGYLEEIECFELEEVEVPKALGDLFESVAGAIYLDSGMSLDAVWKVYYPMIAPAMEHLTKHVPINPVRQVYENLKAQDIFTYSENKGKCYAKITLPNGEEIVGVGPNKKVAKRSASKRFLNRT